MTSSSPPPPPPDQPSKLSLTPDQHKYCSEALSSLKNKLLNLDAIVNEFSVLQPNRLRPSQMKSSCTVALDSVNTIKNRYTDVIPFDRNRVVLKQCKDYRPAARVYINASFVRTYSSENISHFIATQGPLPHTYEYFWEMVIQCHCPVFVMLTLLVDNYKSEEKPLSVLHVLYPEWPDHGVPKDTLAVREIIRRIYQVPLPPSLEPIVVDCSADIGRTGAYCAIHCTIRRILSGNMSAFDLLNTVTMFRPQRIGMVQTLEQYLYCHRAIVDELEELVQGSNAERNPSSQLN